MPLPRDGDVPLAFAQQRLWLLDRLAPGNPFYNLGGAARLRGELSVAALAAAVAEVVRRHETLRSAFGELEGRPVLRIAPAERGADGKLPLVDLSALPAAARQPEVERLAVAHRLRPFDLSRSPLLRLALVRCTAGEHVLLFALHHIIADGWSLAVLVEEVVALYGACRRGARSPLPELPVQYGDYAAWQREWLRGEVLEQELAWWRERLAGLPVVELPGDRPRPPVQSFRGGRVTSALGREATRAAMALARWHGVSLYMVLLAAFDTLVWRYGAPPDVVVGTPIANRTRREVEGLIGLFVNTLVLRTDLGGDPPFSLLLGRVRETALGAYAHQDVPFEQLVEELHPRRDLSRNPLFQLMFNLVNTPQPSRQSATELAFEPMAMPGNTALFDLQVYLGEGDDGVDLLWEYASDLFDRVTIARLAAHFGTLLTAAVSSPEERIGDLPLLGADERRQLLVEWNATGRQVPAAAVHELIAAQAARQPEAVALSWRTEPAEELSYGELMQRAASVSAALRGMGAGPETLVAVMLERTPALLVSLLGVLGAGAAYVPVDPEYPAERQRLMLEDSGATVVLTQATLAAALPAGSARVLLVQPSGALAASDGDGGDDGKRGDRRAGAAPAAAPPPPAVAPENLAYVIYTSGSTGRPKGVAIPHGALTNFLLAMRARPGLTAGDVLLAVTSPSFDIAGLELYLPLLVGGRIELASREEASDGGLLLARLRQSGATAMQATPATWRMLLAAGWGAGDEGRRLAVLCGGEALSPGLAAELTARAGSVWNVYGPTETTVWSTLAEVLPGTAVTIGGPIANTEVYVLGGNGEPVAVGVPGELYL
ncbi:MAG TPA: condensation domain-containing protein, partial [Thermoanaerobaculia bacterium]|nr:condensation domain-containing protein [Thermoanaerobaculia bacterium]